MLIYKNISVCKRLQTDIVANEFYGFSEYLISKMLEYCKLSYLIKLPEYICYYNNYDRAKGFIEYRFYFGKIVTITLLYLDNCGVPISVTRKIK